VAEKYNGSCVDHGGLGVARSHCGRAVKFVLSEPHRASQYVRLILAGSSICICHTQAQGCLTPKTQILKDIEHSEID
jgi:hypothetical protein